MGVIHVIVSVQEEKHQTKVELFQSFSKLTKKTFTLLALE